MFLKGIVEFLKLYFKCDGIILIVDFVFVLLVDNWDMIFEFIIFYFVFVLVNLFVNYFDY